ncbi:MAG TPA: AAA family ATPase, partial [Chloroflexota bacterium]|nr:AAA family ATPase [Chloroflexota bacterium]
AVEPLELKGKTERVPAFRVLGLRQRDATMRRVDVPMVGRDAELGCLLGAFAATQEAGAPRRVVLLGDPGVGKTRLTQAFADRVGDGGRILRGRCLSYGRGITFWPLVEIVRSAAGMLDSDPPEIARKKLECLVPDAPGVVARVASAIGIGETTFPLEEVYWGTRKLVEVLAAEGPLVVLVEDVHWAETSFLDLLDHLAARVAGPLLLVCSARPELLDLRSAWRDEPRLQRVELEPLTAMESAQLVENLLGTSDLPSSVRERVGTAAEGNPLFVEQLVAMLLDEGFIRREGDRWRLTRAMSEFAVPGSIHALLAARLDLLTPEERAVLEPASVIGLQFPEDAVAELAPESLRPALTRHLADLIRKRLVHAEVAQASGRSYRFQHILIRETAYNRILKRGRAALHERFADWEERANRDREGSVGYDEIHGYHLEQAYRYLAELAPLDDRGRQLGARGAVHLAAAGTRAFERGDMSAASNLLRRAVALLPQRAPDRAALLPRLSEALMESGEFAAADTLVEEAVSTAQELNDTRLLADALLTRLLVRHHASDDLAGWFEQVERETARLIPSLERVEAHAELAIAWRLVAFVRGTVCQWEQVVAAEQRGIEHARRAGRRRLEARMSAAMAQALRDGPTPVPEAIRRCQEILAAGLVDQQAQVLATVHLAYLYGLAGELARARALYAEARLRLSDLGGGALTAASLASLTIGRIELLADETARATDELRSEFQTLGEMGERYFRPSIGALLAQAVCASGLYHEAIAISEEVEAISPPDDPEAQAIWRTARAKAQAALGCLPEALRLTEEAVDILAATDALVWKADTLFDRAIVLMQAGRSAQATEALRQARELYLLKGAALPLHRADALLAGLDLLSPVGSSQAAMPEMGKSVAV